MTDKPTSPLSDRELRRLIAETAAGLGEGDPAQLPHRVRTRLQGQVSDDLDIQAILADLARETGSSR